MRRNLETWKGNYVTYLSLNVIYRDLRGGGVRWPAKALEDP
jgi:hypothetical protein